MPAIHAIAVAVVCGSALADPFGFSPGLAPVDLQPGNPNAPGWMSAAECGDCHAEQHAQWEASRHRMAWTNALFQAGYLAEPKRFCVNCHAPLRAQAAEIDRNRAWRTAEWRTGGQHSVPFAPEPHAAEGVTCAVCHLRDGDILVAELPPNADEAVHGFVVEPAIREATFCTSCHQFAIPNPAGMPTQLMQATAREHAAWSQASGHTTACQGCHMPGGSHAFGAGAHDLDALASAVEVRAEAGALTLRSVGVGHHLPTGDLFRHLTVDVEVQGSWTVVATLGRQFSVEQGTDGQTIKREAGTTALVPGVPQRVPLPQGATHWRVVYHYGGPHDEARGLLDPRELTVVLHTGSL